MERSRRADAVVFGFDFQVNAAIVIFLENVKKVKSLRLEGNYEDIELELDNGKYILAQAKSVEKASDDFSNVRNNMKKALTSLSDASKKTSAESLIVVTNSPNPFNDDSSKSVFYGHTHRMYKSLPKSAKELVDSYLKDIPNSLDKDRLMIQVIPFETDDDNERYKVIMQCINDFIGEINPNIPGIGRRLLDVWHWQVFDNGGKHDSAIKLNKKDIIWPILVMITELSRCDDKFLSQFDEGVYEEVSYRYAELINNHCENCEFFIKVLSSFNAFKQSFNSRDVVNSYINEKWCSVADEYFSEIEDYEIKEAITKIVMYQIIKQRFAIDRVKEGKNL